MTRRFLLAVLVLLPVAGCAELLGIDPSDGNGALEPAEAQGLSLTMAASRAQISPGDTVRLVATLSNQNAHAVRIDFGSGCQILPYVKNAAGKIVYPHGGGWGCTAALTSLLLAPGEKKEMVHAWTGEQVEYETGTSKAVHRPLPGGAYRAYAVLEGNVSGQPLKLKSAEAAIQIR